MAYTGFSHEDSGLHCRKGSLPLYLNCMLLPWPGKAWLHHLLVPGMPFHCLIYSVCLFLMHIFWLRVCQPFLFHADRTSTSPSQHLAVPRTKQTPRNHLMTLSDRWAGKLALSLTMPSLQHYLIPICISLLIYKTGTAMIFFLTGYCDNWIINVTE